MFIDWAQFDSLWAEGCVALGSPFDPSTGRFVDAVQEAEWTSHAKPWPEGVLHFGLGQLTNERRELARWRTMRLIARSTDDPALRNRLDRTLRPPELVDNPGAFVQALREAPSQRQRAKRWQELQHLSQIWEAAVEIARHTRAGDPTMPAWRAEVVAFSAERAQEWIAYREELLDRLFAWLRAHEPERAATLKPGLTPDAIQVFEAELGRSLPAAWRALYARHDGQAEAEEKADDGAAVRLGPTASLFHNAGWLELASVRHLRGSLASLVRDAQLPTHLVDTLPWLETGSGNLYLMDISGALGSTPGPVLYFDHEFGRCTDVEYLDLDCWLESFVLALEAGLFATADGDLQPRDREAWRTLRVSCSADAIPLADPTSS